MRPFTTTTTMAALLLTEALANTIPRMLPVDPRDIAGPDTPWISVDPSGSATTITPSVTRDGGAVSTISGPPAQLTSTKAYTLTVSGTPTTVTGQPPVASATGTGPQGVFLACDKYVGEDKPFCSPQRGSALYPGRTYYITWDTDFFASPRAVVDVDITYDNGQGVNVPNLEASRGFYAWSLPSDFLDKQNGGRSFSNVSIALTYEDTPGDNSSEKRQVGPTVSVTPAPRETSSSGVSGGAVAGIVIVIIIVLAVAGLLFWSWRTRGSPFAFLPGVGGAGGRRRSAGVAGGQGYGEGQQSHVHRAGAGAGAGAGVGGYGGTDGAELTDRDSWSPRQEGRNVFQEEVRRQETERS